MITVITTLSIRVYTKRVSTNFFQEHQIKALQIVILLSILVTVRIRKSPSNDFFYYNSNLYSNLFVFLI